MQKIAIITAFVLTGAPAIAHPGHGLPDGMGHDVFHAVTAASVVALVVLSVAGALRYRASRRDRGGPDRDVAP
jgi:hypothetical protein